MNPIRPLPDSAEEHTPAWLVAGALAHLATHMTTGCSRAAHLAALLLERVANDGEADPHLRDHARDLVEILHREAAPPPADLPPRRVASSPAWARAR